MPADNEIKPGCLFASANVLRVGGGWARRSDSVMCACVYESTVLFGLTTCTHGLANCLLSVLMQSLCTHAIIIMIDMHVHDVWPLMTCRALCRVLPVVDGAAMCC